jgi:hypothetical protein
MHSRICAGLLTAVVVLVIGCSQSPVAPTPTPTAQSAAATTVSAVPGGTNTPYGMKGQEVPFSGAATGEAVFDFVDNPKGCASTFTTITTARGQVTHMGLSTWQSQHCLGPESQILDAEVVLTAANGDKVYGEYTGSCAGTGVIGESVICTGDIAFSGGTGRFEQATGTAEWSGAIVFEGFGDFSWPGRWEWKGNIKY